MGLSAGICRLVSILLIALVFSSGPLWADDPKNPNDKNCETILTSSPQDKVAAAEAFQKYFNALNGDLVERNEILKLISVALLAKEHVLLMGPPGNAKSMISDAVLGQIVDKDTGKPSYYRIQMTPETTMSETHGPIDPKTVFESGRITRHYDQGMLFSKNVFIDEIFDARANAQRNILGLLAERHHAQGTEIIPGKIETAIGATNRYLDQIYEKAGDEGPKALVDRFSFNVYVPGEFQFTDSYMKIIGRDKGTAGKLPQLTFAQLDTLRAMVKQVQIPESVAMFLSLLSYDMKGQTEAMEQAALKLYRKKQQDGANPPPPYRATKYHSPRTLYKASQILRAFVIEDWIAKGGKRPLNATIEDLKLLKKFFILAGPNEEFAQKLLDRTVNPYERSQLSATLEESKLFDGLFNDIARDMNEVVYKYALESLESDVTAAVDSGKKDKVVDRLLEVMVETRSQMVSPEQADQTGQFIGYLAVADFVDAKLKALLGSEYDSKVGAKLTEVKERRAQAEAEERARVLRQAQEARQKKVAEEREQAEKERRERREQVLRNHMIEVFKDPAKNLTSIVEVIEPLKATPAPGEADGNQNHVRIGDQTLVFLPGEKGYRLRHGKLEEFEYDKTISDTTLRQILKKGKQRQFVGIGNNKFAVRMGSLFYVVNAETFSVEQTQMLTQSDYFAFTNDGRFAIDVQMAINNLVRYNLETGESVGFSFPNGTSYRQHMTPGTDILNGVSENKIYMGYNTGQHLFEIDLRSGAAATTQVGGLPIRLFGSNAVAHAKDVWTQVVVNGNINLNYIDLVDPTKSKNQLVNHPMNNVLPTDATNSPDGRFTVLTMAGGNRLVVVDRDQTDQAKAAILVNIEVPNAQIVLGLKWLDSEHLLYRAITNDNKTLYRILKVNAPDPSKFEATEATQEPPAPASTPAASTPSPAPPTAAHRVGVPASRGRR